jgi:hypothetical protein
MRKRPSFIATFRPADHWSDSIRRHAGVRCVWSPLWVIGDGPFKGQWACMPIGAGGSAPHWAPESELADKAQVLR